MTGKEALENLNYRFGKGGWGFYIEEQVSIIKNDLDVLDIIKKYWNIEINNLHVSISYKETSPIGLLPIEETNKIKEWLENEKV